MYIYINRDFKNDIWTAVLMIEFKHTNSLVWINQHRHTSDAIYIVFKMTNEM